MVVSQARTSSYLSGAFGVACFGGGPLAAAAVLAAAAGLGAVAAAAGMLDDVLDAKASVRLSARRTANALFLRCVISGSNPVSFDSTMHAVDGDFCRHSPR